MLVEVALDVVLVVLLFALLVLLVVDIGTPIIVTVVGDSIKWSSEKQLNQTVAR